LKRDKQALFESQCGNWDTDARIATPPVRGHGKRAVRRGMDLQSSVARKPTQPAQYGGPHHRSRTSGSGAAFDDFSAPIRWPASSASIEAFPFGRFRQMEKARPPCRADSKPSDARGRKAGSHCRFPRWEGHGQHGEASPRDGCKRGKDRRSIKTLRPAG